MTDTTDWSSIDSLWDKMQVPRHHINQSEDNEVKLVTYDFSDRTRFKRTPERIEITHLTDTQYGHRTFQMDRFLAHREWVLEKPERFVLMGGDMIDAATVLSIGSPYENTGEPIDQIDGLIHLLKPLSDAGRLLGSVGGNHERRTIKTFGDCGRLIARELKVPYSRGVLHINIRFGEHQPFKVSLWHGKGASGTKGGQAQMLHRFMVQGDSHLYLVGHLHTAMLLWDWRQQRYGDRIKFQKIAGAMSSSFLGYWNSYAETAAMNPSESMMARATLEPNGHWGIEMR